MSYAHRKDDRNDIEFSEYIKATIQREGLWSEILCKELSYIYGCEVDYDDYADGGDGRIIKAHIDATPDKIFTIKNKKITVEIKTFNKIINDIKFFTFKLTSLLSCYNNNSYIIIPNYKWWSLIQPNTCKYLIDNFKSKIYSRFSPNDKAIRIYADDIRELRKDKKIQLFLWKSNTSTQMIEYNKLKLFYEKHF